MSTIRSAALASVCVLACAGGALAEQATFRVKHHFRGSPDSTRLWWLVESNGNLVLDDTAKTVSLDAKPEPWKVGFDAIERVIFEQTTHKSGTAWGGLFIGGSAIDNKNVSDSWCYIEDRDGGALKPYVLLVPKESAAALQDKMKAMLGAKVSAPVFSERPESIKADTLADLKSKQDFKSDSKNRPMPEAKPGKALVVVANPLLDDPMSEGPLIRLFANGHVVAVNGWGTYAFANLDPGDYVLAAQYKDNVSALHVTLEAGKDYYFLEDMVKDGALLTRHTKELVMHQVSGTRYADWKTK